VCAILRSQRRRIGYLLLAAECRSPTAGGDDGANKMSAVVAIGGTTGMFNHYTVLRRHGKILS